MDKQIQHQFEGFICTQSIFSEDWFGEAVTPFDWVDEEWSGSGINRTKVSPDLMLGKRAELFFGKWIQNSQRYQLLKNGIQIQREGITLGELDFLVKDRTDRNLIHVELAYKLYLLDCPDFRGWDERHDLRYWVGPNKNDRLKDKLDRLRTHQFPLLNQPETIQKLRSIGIEGVIKQQLCLKAKLFIPLGLWEKRNELQPTFRNCLEGWWMRFDDFRGPYFENEEYWIPDKTDWMTSPNLQDAIQWQAYSEVQEQVADQIRMQKSTMVRRKNGGPVHSFFVVWW